MPNPYFRFKQFKIYHDRCAMKVTTDACLFGAWCADILKNSYLVVNNLLDIGTGTGLLSLMIGQKNDLLIDAVEIDQEAAQQARENVSASPWNDRINIINDDILEFNPGKQYDVIISNPPFYENELTSQKLKKNIAHHSHYLSISQVTEIIKNNLNNNGLFFLLLPFKRTTEVEILLREQELHLLQKLIVRQSVNHSPFRSLIMGSKEIHSALQVSELSIWDQHQQYTLEFTALLKDYYLNL
jgi:tRNA1Val (adenine37-N6)-methyltransferase